MSEHKEVLQILSRQIGNGPVLKQYFERMNLVKTINTLVPPKAEELSCGEAVAALVAMVLNRRHALYNLEHWAQESAVLACIFLQRSAPEYNDDRLDDSWMRSLLPICAVCMRP